MLNIRKFTIINLCNWILLITFAQKFNYSLLIMAEKKTYCIKTETLARFAKALGHPARIAIMKLEKSIIHCWNGTILLTIIMLKQQWILIRINLCHLLLVIITEMILMKLKSTIVRCVGGSYERIQSRER